MPANRDHAFFALREEAELRQIEAEIEAVEQEDAATEAARRPELTEGTEDANAVDA